MPDAPTPAGCPLLAQIGGALVAASLVVPAFAPLACVAFAAVLAGAGCSRNEAAAEAARNEAAAEAAREEAAAEAARDDHHDDAVARASEDSFPASDSPSWTPITGPGTRH